MYAYTQNNPVMYSDISGYFAISIFAIGVILGSVLGATVGGVIAYNVAKNKGAEGWELVGWTALGVLGGGAVGAAAGYTGALVFSKITGIIGFSVTPYSIVPIKEITILGSYPLYKDSAILTNSGYYDIGNIWNNLTQAQRSYNNSTYLADAYKLGSKFAIFTEKVTKVVNALWEEIQYLIENGIPFEMF